MSPRKKFSYQWINLLNLNMKIFAAILFSSFITAITFPITDLDGIGGTGHDVNEDSDLERSLLAEEKL